MSLTSLIKQKDSKLMKGLAELGYTAESMQSFIDQHNDQLAKVTPIATHYWNESDWPMTGSAMIHLMARHTGGRTMLHGHVPSELIERMNSLSPTMGALMAAMIEHHLRAGTQLKLINGNLALPSGELLIPKTKGLVVEKLASTHEELKALEPVVIEFAKKYAAVPKEYHKTFDLSLSVGGADANLYMGGWIYDIKTSRKRRPLQADDLIQQLLYGLMIYAEGGAIEGIGFFYPRHNMDIRYPFMQGIVADSGFQDRVQEFIDRLFHAEQEWDDSYKDGRDWDMDENWGISPYESGYFD